MTFQVPADMNGRLSFAFVNSSGKPAPVDANTPLTVTSSDETVAKFSISGSDILIDTQGPGKCTGTLDGDADLGAGVTDVQGVFEVEVTPLNASAVQFGGSVTLEPKPAP